MLCFIYGVTTSRSVFPGRPSPSSNDGSSSGGLGQSVQTFRSRVEVLQTDGPRVTAARIELDECKASEDSAEPGARRPTPPACGSYVVRETGEWVEVAGTDGRAVSRAEATMLRAYLGSLAGNPGLARVLAANPLSIGGRFEVPKDVFTEAFRLGGNPFAATVERASLKLVETRRAGTAEVAVFDAEQDMRASPGFGMSAEVRMRGRMEFGLTTCRLTGMRLEGSMHVVSAPGTPSDGWRPEPDVWFRIDESTVYE